MAHVLSLNAKLYRNTGTYGTPTWDEITLVKDLTLNLTKGTSDVTTRASAGWTEEVDGLKTASIDYNHLWDTADADFTAVRSAFTGNTSVEVLCLDGSSAVAGNQGLRATMLVANFSRNEQLPEALTVDVSLKPVKNSNSPPAWHTVP